MTPVTPRVFVSHLSGVPVFDPNGDQVGRVRDWSRCCASAAVRPGCSAWSSRW